jgi:hypothetical protein
MLDAGMEIVDFKHLERLSDPEILRHLPETERNLRYNYQEDVVKYMNLWAEVLEEQLLAQINLSSLHAQPTVV